MKKPIVLSLILALCTLLSGCIVDPRLSPSGTTTIIIMTADWLVDVEGLIQGELRVRPIA